ncbi:hypothetical protein HZA56_12605 [Candidatus Poribacteria bacterium]|nr:hypothetical protein [Candidatus Poribacteria bacterium]
MNDERIEEVCEEKADELVDMLVRCTYCSEPFKECDTLTPGIGLTVGETDVAKYHGMYWHHGCVQDYEKENCRWLRFMRISLRILLHRCCQFI